MPRYRYKALDSEGAATTGEIVADTRGDALEHLARTRRTAVALDETLGPVVEGPWWQRDVLAPSELPIGDLSSFTRELASLTSANVPIDEALRLMLLQPAIGARQRRVTKALLARVTEGQSLSAALAQSKPGFPAYYARLVEAAETGGTLGPALDDLATFIERSAEVRARVLSALVYPAVLVMAALLAITVIAGVLVPAVQPIFEDAGVAPPFIIRLLGGISAFLTEKWWLVLALLAGLGALAVALLRDSALRTAWDGVLLRLPILGRLIVESETARIARTLSALVRNGVPLADAVRVSSGVVSNRVLGQAITEARKDIEEGVAASTAFARSGLYPELFVSLTRVGEETGQLDPMLARVAATYDALVVRRTERLMTLLTPVLTVVIGGFVGLLLISVMNAILSVNELVMP
ncbi:MAG: type II secretion system F family protein [Hyphomicrobium sp.]|nr:type II secretion system F family protein [Hyphomicrobium sp.]